MLAEVQAANAALSQIMNLVRHGQDISQMAGSCADYFNSKAIIARCSNKKGSKSQIQTFMEFEKLRQQEYKLREIMIYSGSPGMWDRWLEFQRDCKRERAAEAKKKRMSDKKELEEVMSYVKMFGGCLSTLVTIMIATFEGLKYMGYT